MVLIEKFTQAKLDFKEWTETHKTRQEMRIDKHIIPCFDKNISINDITIDKIHACLQKIVAAESYETAKKIYRIIRGVFEYADDKNLLSPENLGIITRLQRFAKTLPKPQEKTRYQVLSEAEIGELMTRLENYEQSTLQVQIAAKLAPFLALRPNELCTLEWADINLEAKEIIVPTHKMKMKREHLVPLSTQAIHLIKQLPQDEPYLFYSPRNKKPITTDSIIRILRKLGYNSTLHDKNTFCTHAFRGMFSSILHQNFKYNSDIIEFQLAHVEKNKVKNSYNRTHLRSYLEERQEMMQEYANYLDRLKEGYGQSTRYKE